jgi:PBP1b-binding outer membrane lipoprotein LpoB
MEPKMMKRLLQITLVMMTFWVTGCAESTYPISGESCAPDDPVRTLDANDCTVTPGA